MHQCSHLWYQDGIEPTMENLLFEYPDELDLFADVGDVLVFDGRLLHRGTPSDEARSDPKYGIFWSASRNDYRQIDRYLEYLAGRATYLRDIGLDGDYLAYMLARYDDIASVSFPESFEPNAVAILDQAGVNVLRLAASCS